MILAKIFSSLVAQRSQLSSLADYFGPALLLSYKTMAELIC